MESEEALPEDIALIANDDPEEQPPANAIPDAPAAQRDVVANRPQQPRLANPAEVAVGSRHRRSPGPNLKKSRADAEATKRRDPASEAANELAESKMEPECRAAGERMADDDEDREIQALILDGDAGDLEEIRPRSRARR